MFRNLFQTRIRGAFSGPSVVRTLTPLLSLLVLVIALMQSGLSPALADDSFRCVTLAWDAVTENVDSSPCTDLAKYRIHYGFSSGDYTSSVDVTSATSRQICNLQVGKTYYFAVTAIDTSQNESGYSNEVNSFINPSELAQSRPPLLDFDGDGYSSIVAVKNTLSGSGRQINFRIMALDGSTSRNEVFGSRGDLPAPGDYDGDGIADIGVVHRSAGVYRWISKNSSDSQIRNVAFGRVGDLVLAGCQFDGHASIDRATIKSGNKLAVKKSSDGKVRTVRVAKFPAVVSELSCGDLDGDGIDELLVIGRGGPAVRSSSYTRTAADQRWTILGFNALTGRQVYSRRIPRTGKLLALDYDDNGVCDPAYSRKLSASTTRLGIFIGAQQTATVLDFDILGGIAPIKLNQDALGNYDGFVYAGKLSLSIGTYNLKTLTGQSSSLSLAAGERLLGPVSWRR